VQQKTDNRSLETQIHTELALIRGAIEIDHLLVNRGLLSRVHALERRSNDSLNILHGGKNTLAKITLLVIITKLASLVNSSGSTCNSNCT
jgi:hypothetical protein